MNHFDVYSAKSFGFDDDSWTVSTEKRHATVSREVRNLGSLKMAGAPNSYNVIYFRNRILHIFDNSIKKGAA